MFMGSRAGVLVLVIVWELFNDLDTPDLWQKL